MINALTPQSPNRLRSLSKTGAAKAEESITTRADSVTLSTEKPASTSSKTAEVKVQFESPTLGQRMLDAFTSLTRGKMQAELKKINQAEKAASKLKTPEQFQAKTAEFKKRLAAGETLEDLRVEAYAVARQASVVATGMRPYDCQVLGALAMDDGKIAEMMTGEGKTLTAVMPLYLNALAGKGAHLVTVNDTLAQRDREEMGPIFETLGLSVGCVLETMDSEEKRRGYAADVTYTTDRALGFDFLRDRTARRAEDRLQRPLFFALIDEVDQVLLDEARTPLILSGQGEPASLDYRLFDDIVEELRPGVDYFVDRGQGTAWLSETGLDFVENELKGESLDFKDPEAVARYHRKRGAIMSEGKAWKALHDHRETRPGFWKGLLNSEWRETEETLEEAFRKAQETSDQLDPDYNLFSQDNMEKVRVLNASLKAHALFEEGVDYLVQDGQVKIVDENKGRTSKGRRYNEGLHQALEAKSGVPIHPESRPIASITYPNLFGQYERLAGMSGTARSSEGEFQELYDLSVVEVPTNLQFQLNPENPQKARRHNRIDATDAIYASKAEKFEAVVQEAMKAYEEGIPVLVGTLSVEANEYVYARLLEEGAARGAVQLLNAQHVHGDKSLENSIIAEAGRSGMITVATSMAGRGVNIKPDMVNYKKLAMRIEALAGRAGQPVVVDLASQKEADRLAAWLEGNFPYKIGEGAAKPGETLIRVASEEAVPKGAQQLKGSDFPTGGLYVIGTERAKSRRIDDQLIGRAARQGAVGRSKFFLSVEDDLFQHFGGTGLQSTLALLSGKKGHLESELVEGLVEKAQAHVGSAHFEARSNTTKYDEVLNLQRESFYEIRNSILEAGPELKDKLKADTREVVREKLNALLPQGHKHSAAEVSTALKSVSDELKLDLSWQPGRAPRKGELDQSVMGQVDRQLEEAFASFAKSGAELDEPYRQSLLTQHDALWSLHLEDMASLKESIQWVSVVGEKPEDAYKRRGFEAFERLVATLRTASVEENVPQILVGAKVLESDRRQQASQVAA